MVDTVTKALGLVRQYNSLTVAPGALGLAENAIIRRENLIEPRRGFKELYSSFSGDTGVTFFADKVITHDSSRMYYYDSGAQDIDGAVFAPHSGFLPRFVLANQNLYVTASDGVKVLSDLTSGSRRAGAPRGLDFEYALTSGASGFLANTYQCAYRHLYKRLDGNENEIIGYPSQRLWVTNASGAAENVTLTINLGNEVEAGDILQVYRTEQVSGTSSDTSGDEMGLVYEYTVTSTDVTAGSISFTDSITDTLIGATLYTSPSQEGIAQASHQPPVAKDMALYKSNYMFYANTFGKQILPFSLVGTSGLSGNTLTIGGVTYNFGATEIVSGGGAPQVKVYATGVAAADIDDTARSLVKVINQYASNTSVYAYYLSGPEDLPGQILLEEQTLGGSAFTIVGSNTTIGAMTFPETPVSPATTDQMTSSKDTRENALFYSKNQQPEAVPLLNYLLVGPANSAILRIAPLKDSLIIISEAGIFRLTGEDPQSFSVITLDDTVRVKAIESVQVLSNQVYCLSNQGVIRITENGVDVVSREIELDITKLVQFTSFDSYTYSASYESERLYMLSTISADGETAPDVTYVYNYFTRTWTKWTFGFTAAKVWDTEDKMYMQRAEATNLSVERKDFDDTDFADPDFSVTISSITDNVERISSTTTPQIGWVISQGANSYFITAVTLVSSNTYDITLSSDSNHSTGAATIYPSVGFEVEWLGWTANNPATMKQVRGVALLTDDTSGENTVTAFDYSFRSNFEGTKEYVSVDNPRGFGSEAWGIGLWGGGADDTYGYPTFVPLEKQYSNRLYVGVRHRRAREKITIAGMSYEFDMVSEEVGR